MMDLQDVSTTYPNQSDSTIALQIIGGYTSPFGITPVVTPTFDIPTVLQRVPSQQGTDLAFVRSLAQKNGFVFYVQTLALPG